jgi:tetratricopeptide (TPR) repeat protein
VQVKALVIIMLAVSIASAQAPSPESRKQAESHFKLGQAFYNTKQWDKAIGEYQAAWDLSHEPALQFSIGLAFHKKGDLAQALVHYRKYIELDPDGVAGDEARGYIAELTPKVEAEEAARRDAEAKQQREADAAAKAERERADAAAAQAAARERSTSTRQRARTLKWTGIGIAIAGVALVGVGVKYGLDARSAESDVNGHTSGPWTDDLLGRDDDGRSAETKQIVFTSLGAAALIGGGVTYFLGRRADARADAMERRVTIVPGPGVGLAMTARF